MPRHHERNLTVRQTSYISLVTQPSLISPRNSKKPCILLLFSACTVNFHYEKQTEIVSVNTQIKGLKLLCLFQTCNFKRRFYSQMFTFETIKQQYKFGENAQRNGRDRINFRIRKKAYVLLMLLELLLLLLSKKLIPTSSSIHLVLDPSMKLFVQSASLP